MAQEIDVLKSVQEQIKDRIKNEFASLIPDEMWEKMIGEVTKTFFEDKVESWSGGQRVYVSPFKLIIKEEIEARAKAAAKVYLDTIAPYSDGSGGLVVNDALKKMLAENMGDLLTASQAGFTNWMVQNAIQSLRNNLNR